MRLWFLLLTCVFTVAGAAAEQRANLRELLGSGASSDEPLPPEKAFATRAEAFAADAVAITFTPAPTYYLYREKFAFAVSRPNDVQVASVQLPQGEMKDDPTFGRTEVYHQAVQALVNLKSQGAPPQEVELSVTLQGCTERGLCYPPDTRQLRVQLAAAGAALVAGTASDAVSAAQPSATGLAAEQSAATAADTTPPPQSKLALWAVVALLIAGAGAIALWYCRRGHKSDIHS